VPMGASTSSRASATSQQLPIDEDRHRMLSDARAEASRARAEASLARGEVSRCHCELESLRQCQEHYFMTTVGVSLSAAAVAAATAASITVVVMRRRQTAVLAEAAQNIVDLRRRGAANLQKAERFGHERLAKSLLPVLDSMDALVASGGDAEGAALTRDALHSALRSHDIEQVMPIEGAAFDVSAMEAMFTVPGEESGLVAQVFRPGYMLHGERLLRPAQVGVSAKANPDGLAGPDDKGS